MKMIKALLKENETLRELMLGITVFGIIAGTPILIFSDYKIYNTVGFAIGIVVAIFMAVHMAYSIDIAFDCDEKGAMAYMRKMTLIRYAVVCVIIAVIGITKLVNPITGVIGVMGLKVGAYMQPFIHKLIFKN